MLPTGPSRWVSRPKVVEPCHPHQVHAWVTTTATDTDTSMDVDTDGLGGQYLSQHPLHREIANTRPGPVTVTPAHTCSGGGVGGISGKSTLAASSAGAGLGRIAGNYNHLFIC